jgi:hypothetical protein
MGHFRRKKRKKSISFLAKRKHFVFRNALQDVHVVSILPTTLRNFPKVLHVGYRILGW